jgi:RNA polymerase sigma-70 factor (ECF subfamily)
MTKDEARTLVASVFEAWQPVLLRYAERLSGSRELAEDVVQEAFLALYGEVRSGTTPGNPRAWTFSVVRRQVFHRIRRHQREAVHPESPSLLDEMPDPTAGWQPGEGIDNYLSHLSRREEEVLLLRLEGLKYREIAEELGITPSSVNTLLCRALKKLQIVTGAAETGEQPQVSSKKPHALH